MFKLVSPVFHHESEIPPLFTGEGQDLSPPLKWIDVPPTAQELVLICEDPDAPSPEPWVHWLIYGIQPSAVNGLPGGIPRALHLEHPVKASQGINSFGNVGYGGPMPPAEHGIHRYFFKLFALDRKMDLKPGLGKPHLLELIQDHIFAETQLVGHFQRTVKRKRAG